MAKNPQSSAGSGKAGSDGPDRKAASQHAAGGNPGGSDDSQAQGAPDDERSVAELEDELTVAEAGHEPDTTALAEALPAAANNDDTKITIAELKEKIMASSPNDADMNKAANSATEVMNDMQNRSQAAFQKSSESMAEMSDFAKGNVEAVVESSKIVASGLQELGRTYAEEARTAYEQMQSDMKDVAAIKSPTELFQLQSKIMRRNFDMLVAASSKNNEAMMKLATDAFQPLSGRMNAAADKASKIS